MTILVTGAAGFIGSNFVLEWMAGVGEDVVSLDLLTYSGNLRNLAALDTDPRHKFVHGDIGDSRLVAEILEGREPRAVINFAAESHVDRSIADPGIFVETNVAATFRLLESVRRAWDAMPVDRRNAFRFLHVSTDEVYGSLAPEEDPFTERHAYRPNSPYSASKAASDHFVRAYNRTFGLPTITTNCSNNYGPRQFPEKLIPLVIRNALAGNELPVYGDGMQVRDWLYVGDHCSAIRAVLERGCPGATYNIGGNAERANIDIVRTICEMLDERRPLANGASYLTQIRHVADRPGHDRRYAVDSSKAQAEIGWMPLESLESGLEKTVDWYLGNPEWVAEVESGAYRDWLVQQYGANR